MNKTETKSKWLFAHSLTTKQPELTIQVSGGRLVALVGFETALDHEVDDDTTEDDDGPGVPGTPFALAGRQSIESPMRERFTEQIQERAEFQHCLRLQQQMEDASRRERLAAARIAELTGKREGLVVAAGPGLGRTLKALDADLASARAERDDAAAEREVLAAECVTSRAKVEAALTGLVLQARNTAMEKAKADLLVAEQALAGIIGERLEALLVASAARQHSMNGRAAQHLARTALESLLSGPVSTETGTEESPVVAATVPETDVPAMMGHTEPMVASAAAD